MKCKVGGWSTNVTNCEREVTGSQPYTQSYRQLSEVGSRRVPSPGKNTVTSYALNKSWLGIHIYTSTNMHAI